MIEEESGIRTRRTFPYGFVLIAFLCGLGGGILTAATISPIAAFKRSQPPCTPSKVMMPPVTATSNPIVTGTEAATTARPFPANNSAQWAVAVPPGTVLVPLQVQNNAATANIRIAFSATDGHSQTPVAVLWVRSGLPASISLPRGTYIAAISGYATTQDYDPNAATPLSSVVNFTASSPADRPSIAVDAHGQGHFMARPRATTPSRRSSEDDGYDDLPSVDQESDQ